MSRNLKALGLALVALFAFGAVAASAASAHEFHSDGEVTHLTAKAEDQQIFYATPNEKSVRCNEVNVTGTITGTKVETGTYKSDTVTVEPHYTDCGIYSAEGKKLIGATVDSTDCYYKFGSDTVNEHASVEIEDKPETTCEPGFSSPSDPGGITVTVLGQPCIHVEPTTELEGGVHYKDITDPETGLESITVEATVEGIDSVTTNHPLVGCSAVDGETHGEGTYTGNSIVTGFEDAEHTEPTDITLGPDE